MKFSYDDYRQTYVIDREAINFSAIRDGAAKQEPTQSIGHLEILQMLNSNVRVGAFDYIINPQTDS